MTLFQERLALVLGVCGTGPGAGGAETHPVPSPPSCSDCHHPQAVCPGQGPALRAKKEKQHLLNLQTVLSPVPRVLSAKN